VELTGSTAVDGEEEDDTGDGVSTTILLCGLPVDGVVCGFIHVLVFFDFDSLGSGGCGVNEFPPYGKLVKVGGGVHLPSGPTGGTSHPLL
jgi:hypothetical protein